MSKKKSSIENRMECQEQGHQWALTGQKPKTMFTYLAPQIILTWRCRSCGATTTSYYDDSARGVAALWEGLYEGTPGKDVQIQRE